MGRGDRVFGRGKLSTRHIGGGEEGDKKRKTKCILCLKKFRMPKVYPLVTVKD